MLARLQPASSLLLVGSWIAIYVLMTRRGVLDKSYGMPIAALCLNISWEFNFAFLTAIEPVYRIGNGLFFLFDLGVLYTCFRYGAEDFDWPILRRWFKPIVSFTLAASLLGVILFVRAFDDTYGGLFAALNTPLYSALLIAMLLRRDSVRGQSLYIGLLVLIGDSAAYIPTLYAHEQGWAATPVLWIHTFMIATLLLHVLYVALYVYVARRDGIDLWRRL